MLEMVIIAKMAFLWPKINLHKKTILRRRVNNHFPGVRNDHPARSPLRR